MTLCASCSCGSSVVRGLVSTVRWSIPAISREFKACVVRPRVTLVAGYLHKATEVEAHEHEEAWYVRVTESANWLCKADRFSKR